MVTCLTDGEITALRRMLSGHDESEIILDLEAKIDELEKKIDSMLGLSPEHIDKLKDIDRWFDVIHDFNLSSGDIMSTLAEKVSMPDREIIAQIAKDSINIRSIADIAANRVNTDRIAEEVIAIVINRLSAGTLGDVIYRPLSF